MLVKQLMNINQCFFDKLLNVSQCYWFSFWLKSLLLILLFWPKSMFLFSGRNLVQFINDNNTKTISENVFFFVQNICENVIDLYD